jgi:SET domain-containing protein
MRQPAFEIRTSPIEGVGAFATRRIRRGARVIEYLGERISPAEADTRYSGSAASEPHVLLFTVDDRIVIDGGVNGNEARYMNHSCEPNCESVTRGKRIWIYALRDIQPGEELTYDYNLTGEGEDQEAEAAEYPCFCGSSTCRGTMFKLDRSPAAK